MVIEWQTHEILCDTGTYGTGQAWEICQSIKAYRALKSKDNSILLGMSGTTTFNSLGS